MWARRELVRRLVGRELKGRYKGSALGVLWSVLNPLFMAAIYALFFSLIAGVGGKAAVPMIVIGVFAWTFTVTSINGGLMCITGNANLVKKVRFPRVLLPVSVTASGLVDFLISLIIQFVIVGGLLMTKGEFISGQVWMLPFVLVLHTVMNLAMCMIVGACNVYFRDTQHLVGVGVSAWFFLSPVMYDLAFIGGRVGEAQAWVVDAFLLNPLALVITAYRAVILPDVYFPINAWSIGGLVLTGLMALVSWLVFHRLERDFADFV